LTNWFIAVICAKKRSLKQGLKDETVQTESVYFHITRVYIEIALIMFCQNKNLMNIDVDNFPAPV